MGHVHECCSCCSVGRILQDPQCPSRCTRTKSKRVSVQASLTSPMNQGDRLVALRSPGENSKTTSYDWGLVMGAPVAKDANVLKGARTSATWKR
jgi:hypothetical protein